MMNILSLPQRNVPHPGVEEPQPLYSSFLIKSSRLLIVVEEDTMSAFLVAAKGKIKYQVPYLMCGGFV